MAQLPGAPQALEAALTILSSAGIQPAWIGCGGGGRDADEQCGVRLGTGELAVRVVRLPLRENDSPGTRPLGYSLIERHRNTAALATVYLDRVEWLAQASATDTSVLLGRAIAHEIGHLLLGSTEHTSRGVMRAVWSSRTLRHDDDWGFTVEHGARMRAVIRERTKPNAQCPMHNAGSSMGNDQPSGFAF
jgi:hypothetical protein